MTQYYVIAAVAVLACACGNAGGSRYASAQEGNEYSGHGAVPTTVHESEVSHDETVHPDYRATADKSHDDGDGYSHGAGIITFTVEQAQAAGLRTEIVKPGLFSEVIQVSGEILPSPGHVVSVVSPSDGIVTLRGAALLGAGAYVQSAQTLFAVSGKSVGSGDPALKAKAEYESAERQYRRAEELLKINAISRKAYEEAYRDYLIAKAGYEAYDGRSGEDGVYVKTQDSGSLAKVYVSEGDYVTQGQKLADIINGDRLVLKADVPYRYNPRLSGIKDATFSAPGMDSIYTVSSLHGSRQTSSKILSGAYVPVLFSLNNPGDLLPGMYCDVWLKGKDRDGVVTVPELALTEEQGVYYVYVKVCKEEYRKQEVKVGAGDGIRREILSGLYDGDEVVTAAATQVRLASFAGVVPEGHSHSH